MINTTILQLLPSIIHTYDERSLKRTLYQQNPERKTSGNEENTHEQLGLQEKIVAKMEKYEAKIKRTLCKNYMENAYCSYGMKCQFAHGLEELKTSNFSNKAYKTRPCYSFTFKGYCTYGERCNYLHQKLPPFNQPEDKSKWKAIYQNHREVIIESQVGSTSKLIALLQPRNS